MFYNGYKPSMYTLHQDGTCVDGTVHLVGGPDISTGRVEYCHNGTWHSVCASGWEISGREAQFICKTVGYQVQPFSKLIVWISIIMDKLSLITVSVVAEFGRGTSPILPYRIECTIDDEEFSDCSKTEFNPKECKSVAGVYCLCECAVIFKVNFSHYMFAAFCLTYGLTDCSKCGGRIGCYAGRYCNCHYRCFEFGDCCPDIFIEKNCLGMFST